MMTIEEEIEHVFTFLQHPGGFDVDMAGCLCIRPVDECCPPEHWEVDWTISENGTSLEFHKGFNNLRDAVIFFVEKRHYMCNGLDFELLAWQNAEEDKKNV